MLSHAARKLRREDIRRRLLSGETAVAVAERYGLSPGYVRIIGQGVVASRRGDMAAKRRSQLREFHALGQTQAQFVRLTGVSRVRVCQMASALDLKFEKDRAGWESVRAKSAEKTKRMAVLYRAGYTLQQIGDQYGITRERVRQLLGKYANIASAEGGAAAKHAAAKARRKAAKDAKCLVRFGCTHAQYQEVLRLGREMMAGGASRERTPRGAFLSQKRNASVRGIGWELTFWQWWTIWQESGHWHERGRGQGYVMCRVGDEGPYAVGNVFIATSAENVSSGKHKKSALPIGVQETRSGRYKAHRQLNGKLIHLGTFDTPDMAYAAYLMAAEPARAA